jgi:hypothetical protein
MRGAFVLASLIAVAVGACGPADGSPAAATAAASTVAASGEPIVILTRVEVAASEGAAIPATGEVLEGSSLGDAPFCVGGTFEDRHASEDPTMEPYGLLARTITCADGTVSMGFTPGGAPGLPEIGSWTIVSGTGPYDGLAGAGTMETVYDDPSNTSVGHETLTGVINP